MHHFEPWMLLSAWLALVMTPWIAIRRPEGFALSVVAQIPGMRPAKLVVTVAPVATPPQGTEDPTEAEPDVDP